MPTDVLLAESAFPNGLSAFQQPAEQPKEEEEAGRAEGREAKSASSPVAIVADWPPPHALSIGCGRRACGVYLALGSPCGASRCSHARSSSRSPGQGATRTQGTVAKWRGSASWRSRSF